MPPIRKGKVAPKKAIKPENQIKGQKTLHYGSGVKRFHDTDWTPKKIKSHRQRWNNERIQWEEIPLAALAVRGLESLLKLGVGEDAPNFKNCKFGEELNFPHLESLDDIETGLNQSKQLNGLTDIQKKKKVQEKYDEYEGQDCFRCVVTS
jgi:hypothetical protein